MKINRAYRVIHVLRKPLSEESIAANVLKHGTRALNIDACRIATPDGKPHYVYKNGPGGHGFHGGIGDPSARQTPSCAVTGTRVGEEVVASPLGRWPGNVILDPECAVDLGEAAAFFKVVGP